MEVSLRDRSADLASYLPAFRSLRLSYESTAGLPERTIERRLSVAPRDLFDCDLRFLFAYEIFPPEVLTFFGEWQLEGRAMRPGDVIVQQAQLPPSWGVRLLFGVRVLSVVCERDRAGFSYGTLEGHPENGINEFSFTVAAAGITAAVHTRAGSGLPLTRLFAPIVTFPYAAYCNRQAVRCMEERFIAANSR